jgi:hypothetical protein
MRRSAPISSVDSSIPRSVTSRRIFPQLGGVFFRWRFRDWLCKTKYVNEWVGVGVYTIMDDECRWSATHFLPQSIMG